MRFMAIFALLILALGIVACSVSREELMDELFPTPIPTPIPIPTPLDIEFEVVRTTIIEQTDYMVLSYVQELRIEGVTCYEYRHFGGMYPGWTGGFSCDWSH